MCSVAPTITSAQIWPWGDLPQSAVGHGRVAFLFPSIAKNAGITLPRAYQLSDDFKRPASITGDFYDDFMKGLREEPCVIERDKDVQEMMETPDKLRKGMAPR